MFKIACIAAVATVSAVLAAQGVVMIGAPREAAPAAQAQAAVLTPVTHASPSGAAQITKAADGHFWAEANVNNTRVRFLVDTGATAVALSPADAMRLGLHPPSLDYGYKVMTANGEARAARVTLDTISVAGARVDDVEAYVIEKGLDTSLLGMSYLGRLSRFEATQTALILRP